MTVGGDHDVVLVGAGAAGCVMARRLTEDRERKVALLEAGPDYGSDPQAWPAETRDTSNIFPESHPWGYLHAGRPVDRPLALPRARIVGGSTTINGCIWMRGSGADYDGWAALGNPGWSFAELLPYFRRAESDPLGGPLHGTDGPVPVDRVTEDALSPLDRTLVATAGTLGFPWCTDLNGDAVQRPSVGPTPKNVAGGARMHAAYTYLAPVRERPNFTLIPDTLVDRVIIEDGRAAGVRAADGREIRGREVVLCAGAYASPAILLRSGIGPMADLRSLGIPVVADRPGVGANLLDHPTVGYFRDDVFTAFRINPGYTPQAAEAVVTLIKARSNQSDQEVDLYLIHGQFRDPESYDWDAWFLLNLEATTSRGRVCLTSADPAAALEIDHAYLSDPVELEACCDGMELIRHLVTTPPLAETITAKPGQVPTWRDRDELRSLGARERHHHFSPFEHLSHGSGD